MREATEAEEQLKDRLSSLNSQKLASEEESELRVQQAVAAVEAELEERVQSYEEDSK